MELIHCIYASAAEAGFHESRIPALLEQARTANAAHGLTGILLYIHGSFFQVLEGRPADVDATFERIARDPRHSRVTQIIREPIAARRFADWSMGFHTVDPLDAGALIGENDFFRSDSFVTQIGRGRARKLLEAFASGSWRIQLTGLQRVMRA
jgi:hypothetical protein